MIDWIVAAWDWIVANMTNLKDFLWIVFTFIATLVAILTYRRARYTLLQPLRTEVIKRQTDLLVNLLDYFDDTAMFSIKLDYYNIVSYNVIKLLERLDFTFSDKTIFEEIEKERAGAIIDKSVFIESKNMTNNTDEQSDSNENQEDNKYIANTVSLNSNIVQEVFFTQQHFLSKQELKRYAENPFMPKKIKKLLIEIDNDIHENLSLLMEILNDVNDHWHYNKNNIDEDIPVNHICGAVYNTFNRKSRKHDEKIKKIKELIGQYLMVDKKW